jgi:hypothetical protein
MNADTVMVTAICQEKSYPDILIYTVTVSAPIDYAKVRLAVQREREFDLGEAAGEMDVMFCFPGDIVPCADFRE